jgi:outer membrane protein TolC
VLSEQFNPETRRNEYYAIEDLQWTGSLNINQPVIWTNSTLSLSGLLYRRDQRDDSPGSSYFRNYYTDLAVQFRQPLLVPNTQAISLRRAELAYEEAKSEFIRNTLDLRYSVTEGFYRLYSAQEEVAIQQDRVEQQELSYNTAQRKYNSGIIAEVDALQFEVDLAAARNDLLAAENRLLSRENSFKNLIGLSLGDSLTLMLSDTSLIRVAIDEPMAVGMAKQTRVDLQRAQNNIERGELTLDEVRARRSIRGDLFLSYGLNNNADSPDILYTGMRDARQAVLSVSIPVFDWGRHGQEIESATANLESARLTAQNLEVEVERDILDLIRSIATAVRRADVTSRSRDIAEKAYDISVKRFESGTIGSTDLSQAQARLLQARLNALEALIDYNLAVADLTRRTAFDFRTGMPVDLPADMQ